VNLEQNQTRKYFKYDIGEIVLVVIGILIALQINNWNPKIAGELNMQQVKLVKFKGEFIWHKHKNEDQLFFVIAGEFYMQFRDTPIRLQTNDFLIAPRGAEHIPVAENEVSVMLFVPASTLNTRDKNNELTREGGLWI